MFIWIYAEAMAKSETEREKEKIEWENNKTLTASDVLIIIFRVSEKKTFQYIRCTRWQWEHILFLYSYFITSDWQTFWNWILKYIFQFCFFFSNWRLFTYMCWANGVNDEWNLRWLFKWIYIFFGNSKDVILTNEEMANDLFNRRMEKEENKWAIKTEMKKTALRIVHIFITFLYSLLFSHIKFLKKLYSIYTRTH